MSAVTLGAGPAIRYVGALLLLALATALVTDDPPERGPLAKWHRAVGAALMALAVLIHEYGGSSEE